MRRRSTPALGIDPAKKTGWAIILGDEVLARGVLQAKSEAQYAHGILSVVDAAKAEGCSIVACEGQYLGKRRKKGFGQEKAEVNLTSTLVSLVERRGQWKQAALAAGFEWAIGELHVLRRDVLGAKIGSTRAELKEMARWFVRHALGYTQRMTEDECDACVVAYWAANQWVG